MTVAPLVASIGFVEAARAIVGDIHVLTEPGDTAGYCVDWTRRWSGPALAVVRPADVAEVARLIDAARTHGVPLVPQGGNTGLVGGGVPHGPATSEASQAAEAVEAVEAVVSLRRLDDMEPVDPMAGQVTVGAGVTLSRVQAAARAAGWDFGVDTGARDSATIGGMVATNAGGLHVLRYGPMRAQLLGVEAVLGTGVTIRRLSGLVKDNTGYELAQLLCGSEGTLGIVTRVRLRLVPRVGAVAVVLLGLPSMAAAVELASALRLTVPGLRALEVMTGHSMHLTARHLGMSVPPPVPADAAAYLLVEAATTAALAGDDTASEPAPEIAVITAISGAGSGDVGADRELEGAVATTTAERARLWRFREAHSEVGPTLATTAGGVAHKLDVTLPLGELAPFCDDVRRQVESRWPGSTVILFGHVGDGNIHVNVVSPPGTADEDEWAIDELVLGLVIERGGSISAEHGIGVAKKPWLARDRSEAEVDTMRAIKAALDPDNILNPAVLF